MSSANTVHLFQANQRLKRPRGLTSSASPSSLSSNFATTANPSSWLWKPWSLWQRRPSTTAAGVPPMTTTMAPAASLYSRNHNPVFLGGTAATRPHSTTTTTTTTVYYQPSTAPHHHLWSPSSSSCPCLLAATTTTKAILIMLAAYMLISVYSILAIHSQSDAWNQQIGPSGNVLFSRWVVTPPQFPGQLPLDIAAEAAAAAAAALNQPALPHQQSNLVLRRDISNPLTHHSAVAIESDEHMAEQERVHQDPDVQQIRPPIVVAQQPQQDQQQKQEQKQQQQQQQRFLFQPDWIGQVQQHVQQQQDITAWRKILTAYIEPPLNDTIPGTGSRGNLDNESDYGTPPKYVIPLPLRTYSPKDLVRLSYPRVQTCNDMPGRFPIDRGLEIGADGEPIVWNVGDDPTPDDFPQQEAPYCPVEMDPFLPWIHDVFPAPDGRRIHFIAQNKRRCRTGRKFDKDVKRLEPQASLFQAVSVQRIIEREARNLAPNLWHPLDRLDDRDHDLGDNFPPRYRLAPFEEASPDGMYTRFICRFHSSILSSNGDVQSVILGETLSEFPFNYEFVAHRKDKRLLTPKGKDTKFFWSSNLRFDCPLPSDDDALRNAVATGQAILSDGTPMIHVDLIPIRTSVRYENEIHMTEDLIGPKQSWASKTAFDARLRWGLSNVLPRVEASGRWENIPICLPPQVILDDNNNSNQRKVPQLIPDIAQRSQKPHVLSACLWASTEFKTRGLTKGASTDTMDRLREWLEFHMMVGFDHFYIYDNSGAHTNETSLVPIVDLFPNKITRIEWPSIVCNNNIPAHDSTGERSSQYAAENSCRTRYAPFTEWIAVFDTDEYLVPMGSYTNWKDILSHATTQGANILSLRSSRGKLRREYSISLDGSDSFEKAPNATFLEAYNCDSGGIPKPIWADRARKQVYRTNYVLYHYVHYSTVTQGYLQPYSAAPQTWQRFFKEGKPSERNTDETKEAVMVHTKTVNRDTTRAYQSRCHYDYDRKWQGCFVAFAWPNGKVDKMHYHDANGFEYNCFINRKVEDYWVPRLRQALQHGWISNANTSISLISDQKGKAMSLH